MLDQKFHQDTGDIISYALVTTKLELDFTKRIEEIRNLLDAASDNFDVSSILPVGLGLALQGLPMIGFTR